MEKNETVKFSIVVVTLNAEKEIEVTMDSIQSQCYENYEVIVKDGMSKDNTLKYIPNDCRYRIYNKKDTSVYDGMNQAIEYIRGTFVIFLNAGDTFYDEFVLDKIAGFIKQNKIEIPCVLYGDYARNNRVNYQKRKLNGFFLYRKPLCHQSIVYHREIFKHNRYNTDYKISADHELTLRLWKNNVPFVHLGQVVCRYKGEGLSETKNGIKLAVEEKRKAIIKYYSKSEIMRYDMIMKLSFPRIRAWIISKDSPKVVRHLYRLLVNVTSR